MKNKITGVWSEGDYKLYKNKWKNRSEYDIVKEVRSRFESMREQREQGCPMSLEVEKGGSAGSWGNLWNMSDRHKWMYGEILPDRSNLQSPITFSPIQAANAEFANSDISFRFNYLKESHKVGVMLHAQADIDWERRVNNQQNKLDTFDETITRGTSIPFVGWVNKTSIKEKLVVGQKLKKEIDKWKMQKAEEREAELDSVIKEMRPMVKKEKVVEYDDVAYIPTDLFEIYVDDSARNLQGIAYDAMDIAWRQIVPTEKLKSEFRNSTDPYILKYNLDRVCGAFQSEADYAGAVPFFRKPEDITKDNMVELIRYWNKITNKYVVIANDVVLRNAIMPYNHGELPFVRHRFLTWKDQFYGIGMPAVLRGLKGEDEFLTNQLLDQLKLNLNPPMWIDPEYYDEVDDQYTVSMAGQKLKVPAGMLGWMQQSPTSFDYHSMRRYLREDQVVVSGVNPLMSALPKHGEAVRNNMMGMESGLKIIKKGIQNWSFGYWDAKRQMVELRKQMFPISKVEEISDGGKVNLENRFIVMDNARLDFEKDGDVIVGIKEVKSKGRSTVELDENLMKFFEVANVDIRLDLDEVLPMSNAMKLQSIREAMPLILQAFSNPMLATNSAVMQIIKELVESLPMDKKILEYFPNEATEVDIERAEEQNEEILAGEDVVGIPGEDPQHIFRHYRVAMALAAQLGKINAELAGVDMEASLIETPEEMLEFIEGVEANKEGVALLQEAMARIGKHIQLDETPKNFSGQGAQGVMSASGPEQTPEVGVPGGEVPIEGVGPQPTEVPIEDIQQL